MNIRFLKSRGPKLALASAMMLALGSGAFAQVPDTDFQVEQFEPLPSQGTNILNIGKSEVLPAWAPSFGLVLHYADDEFQLVQRDDEADIVQRIIDHQFKGEIWASLGIGGFAELGVMVPLVIDQKAGELVTSNPAAPNFDSFVLGDIRIVPKIRILDNEGDGIGLGLAANLFLPTGDKDSYHSEGNFRAEPRLLLDYASGGFVAAINVGYSLKAKRDVLNHISDDVLKFGLGLEIPLVNEGELALISSTFGAVGLDADNNTDIDEKVFPLETLLGIQWWASESFLVNAGGGLGLTGGVGSPDFRIFASLGYTPRGEAAGPLDTDGDGIIDELDKCPLEPEDKDSYQDEDGCPDPDNDSDGVLDVDDKCPMVPEDKDGWEDADGCEDPDNDGDGVPDVTDGEVGPNGFGNCLNDPEDKDGFEDANGCPDPDNDGDGILDVVDGDKDATGFGACRDQPEDFDKYQDEDGCPEGDRPLATFDAKTCKIEIADKVYFRTAKHQILEKSFPLLDAVAGLIKDIPKYDHVFVGGHTDFRGSARYNRALSDRRAKSVRKYLISQGIPSRQLKAKGFGEDQPIATNDTPEGMAQNRRVEFKVVGGECTK